jgi:proline iminopeptidase
MLMFNCTLSIEESFRSSWIPKAYEFVGIKNPTPYSGDSIAVLKRLMDVIGKLKEKELMWKMAFASPENEMRMNKTYHEIPDWNNDFSSVALTLGDYLKDYRKNTSNINVPVLFFYGKTDWSIGPDHYKGIHFPEIILWGSDVGHFPFLENKADLGKAIERYLVKYKF